MHIQELIRIEEQQFVDPKLALVQELFLFVCPPVSLMLT